MLFDPRGWSAGNVDTGQLKSTAILTAGAKAAVAVASRMSPGDVKLVSQLLHAGQQLDNVLGQKFEDKPNALLGGMTPKQAHQFIQRIHEARPARKANFYVRLTDYTPHAQLDGAGMLALLAVDVSYNPATLTGEKVNIGGAVMDKLTGSESVELRITAMDDEAGTLKSWFDFKCAMAARQDGTFGLPAQYCVNVEVVHGLPHQDVKPAPGRGDPYTAYMLMRPASIEHDLSRREQGLAEVTMTFTQFDTFVSGGL